MATISGVRQTAGSRAVLRRMTLPAALAYVLFTVLSLASRGARGPVLVTAPAGPRPGAARAAGGAR
ncbi:hypothetical protein GCM10012275_62390 [Longimycelium tulufanense]|uniref:Uncharacterized protein n=1 Tax=Longimycelium tulufanense TaxID=907463 RepID=A0A8J3FX47_9PSEU|nr:hypothetical protein [Longimycelium tulufanense]GGM83299.1 hypothetical protein GCM10012275_62390 [Longimycelium tulufanense]